MATILLTDPEQRACLAAARSLARRGHRVLTIGASRGIAGVSRAVTKAIRIPAEDLARASMLIEAVADSVRAERVDVVVPVSDASSRILLGADLGARVAGPSAEAYARASDKERLLEMAAACGLRVPRQQVLATADATDRPAITGPVVVKPAKSVVEVDGRSSRQGVRFVDDISRFHEVLAEYPPEAYPLLVQERTIGDGIGVFLLRIERRTRLQFAHRRLREKPPAGGVSTYRESIVPPADLLAKSEQLLDQLEYSGPAMIEFKQDAATGDYVLMEINARLWGSLQLAIDAGVDFPAALIATTLGMPLDATHQPRLGVRTVWELGELDHALAVLRRSPAELHVPSGFPVGLRAAARALTDHRWSDHPEVFRWSDPLPFALECLRWLAGR